MGVTLSLIVLECFICSSFTVYDVSLEEIPPTLSPIYRCPVGWKAYGDYCFYVQLSEGSWQDARDQCRSLSSTSDSELASIHNSNENEFVAALVAQCKWRKTYILQVENIESD